MADPNPEAAHGAARLRAAGIAVEVGLLRGRGARAQHRLRVADDARAPLGADEGGREPRWPHRARRRANRNGSPARPRAPTATAGARAPARSSPASAPCGRTIRSLPCARSRHRGSRDAIVVDRHGETPPTAKVLAGAGALVVTAGERNPLWPAGVEVLVLPDADRPRRSCRADAGAGRARHQRTARRGGRQAQRRAAGGGRGRRAPALPRALPFGRSRSWHRRVQGRPAAACPIASR